jgi:hypothetical protein
MRQLDRLARKVHALERAYAATTKPGDK